MAAQCCRAAALDGAQHIQLVETEPRSILFHEAVAQCVKEIGHLHGGPAHYSGFWSRRDRGTWVAGLVPMRSSGVETPCKWVLQRCR
jgi:hypothetical protein